MFNIPDGKAHGDNHERMIFFCKGVLETVKKLGWSPDIIHCHGWFTSILPVYVKKGYIDDPIFSNAKLVYSSYNNTSGLKKVNKNLMAKAITDQVSEDDLAVIATPTMENMELLAAQYSDAIAFGSDDISSSHKLAMAEKVSQVLDYQDPENYVDAYDAFYDSILEESSVLVD